MVGPVKPGPRCLAAGTSQVSFEWGVTDSYAYSLLNVPWWPLAFPVDYGETVRAYWVSCGVMFWCIVDWALRCSLSWTPKDLPDSSMYSSGQLMCWHLNLYVTPLFCNLLSLSLWAIRRVLMVLVPPRCTWIPKLLHVLFKLSPQSMYVKYHNGNVFAVKTTVVVVVVVVHVLGCWIVYVSLMVVVFVVKFVM